MRQAFSRASERATTRAEAFAEFHVAAGHAGAIDGCQDCADQAERQRQAAAALRAHQRRTRQRIDGILGRPS